MSIEPTQLQWMLIATLSLFFLALIIIYLERIYRTHSRYSARFATAKAGSNYARKIRFHVGAGLEILMPIGRGLYPLSLKPKKQEDWESAFFEWARQGVRVEVIMIDPPSEAVDYWNSLSDRIGASFNITVIAAINAEVPMLRKLSGFVIFTRC